MGNELREGNAEISEGNGRILYTIIALDKPGRMAMRVLIFIVAFAFEIKITRGNHRTPEILAVASDNLSAQCHACYRQAAVKRNAGIEA